MNKFQIVTAYIMAVLSLAMFVVFAIQGEELSIIFMALADLYLGRANDLRAIAKLGGNE